MFNDSVLWHSYGEESGRYEQRQQWAPLESVKMGLPLWQSSLIQQNFGGNSPMLC
jgi:hypothetical protein